VTVETILRQKGTDVATIEPDASIRRAADWLRIKNIGALVVTSGKAVLGLISEREIVHAFSRYGESAPSMPVKEIMRYGVITVSPDESVSHVMQLMTRHRIRHMPVLRDGEIAGIISIGDVVKHVWRIWSLRPTSCAMPIWPRIESPGVARSHDRHVPARAPHARARPAPYRGWPTAVDGHCPCVP